MDKYRPREAFFTLYHNITTSHKRIYVLVKIWSPELCQISSKIKAKYFVLCTVLTHFRMQTLLSKLTEISHLMTITDHHNKSSYTTKKV